MFFYGFVAFYLMKYTLEGYCMNFGFPLILKPIEPSLRAVGSTTGDDQN